MLSLGFNRGNVIFRPNFIQPLTSRAYSDNRQIEAGDGVVGKYLKTAADHFGKMIRQENLFVDKSLFIKDFFYSEDSIVLITRPRRFGKSLNLSMVQHFFAKAVSEHPTEGLFKGLRIAKNVEFMKVHQGKYPVISVSFKDIKEDTFEETIDSFKKILLRLYADHGELLVEKKHLLNEIDQQQLNRYLSGEISKQDIIFGLQFLSRVLYKVNSNKECIILIDEYDAPLESAYEKDFLPSLVKFMRNMLSDALKGNQYISKALITGVVRISHSGMLSGLNNLKLFTVLDEEYQNYFGFTEAEVTALMKHRGIQAELTGVKKYYNGYKIADTILYNPWSIMQFIRSSKLDPYWILTSGDSLIKKILLRSDSDDKEKMLALMQGKTVSGPVSLNLHYEDLMQDPSALWSILLFSGYLTAESQKTLDDLTISCQLKIPNEEVFQQYKGVFKRWIETAMGRERYNDFVKNLIQGDVEAATMILNKALLQVASFRDLGGSEKFYHGLMIGVVLDIQDTHIVSSNRESGRGYYDALIIPKTATHTKQAVLFEFKYDDRDFSKEHDETVIRQKLKTAADLAIQQINHKQYSTILIDHPHITSLLKIGLVFNSKMAVSSYSTEKIHHPHTLSASQALLSRE